jgi:hypothetical protein
LINLVFVDAKGIERQSLVAIHRVFTPLGRRMNAARDTDLPSSRVEAN